MIDGTQSSATHQGQPWGPLATAGATLLIGVAYLALQYGVLALILWITGPDAGRIAAIHGIQALRDYGDVLTLGLLVSAIGAGSLLLWLTRARRGITLGQYLAWRRVSFGTIAFWLGLLLLYIVAWELLAHYLGHDQTAAFMRTAYRTTHLLPLLWLAVIVVAPTFEELWFRGFLFAGIARTRLGVAGAILLTAGLWAALHMQYDLYDMTSVFLLGLLFGAARHRTGSLWPSLSMHMFANLVATVETAAKLMR